MLNFFPCWKIGLFVQVVAWQKILTKLSESSSSESQSHGPFKFGHYLIQM